MKLDSNEKQKRRKSKTYKGNRGIGQRERRAIWAIMGKKEKEKEIKKLSMNVRKIDSLDGGMRFWSFLMERRDC